jgi:CHAT domain-containing protein/tetratricopeptide (TPR) repeat protein
MYAGKSYQRFAVLNSLRITVAVACFSLALLPAATAQSRLLALGQSIIGQLRSGHAHRYALVLSRGQFVHFRVSAEDPGSEIRVLVSDPGGNLVRELSGRVGPFSLYYLPTLTGSYQISLHLPRPHSSPPSAGSLPASEKYTIQVDELHEASEQDGIRAAANRALVEAYRLGWQKSPQSTISAGEKFDEAISLFRTADDQRGEAEAFQTRALLAFDAQDYGAVVAYLQQALPRWQALGDRAMAAKTLEAIAASSDRQGNTDAALEAFNAALLLRQSLTDRTGEARVLEFRGDIYLELGEFQKALNDKQRTLSIVRSTQPSSVAEYYALYDLGEVYAQIGEPQKALVFYQKAYTVARVRHDHDLIFTLTSVIGDAYAAAGDPGKGLAYHRRSLALARGDLDSEIWATRRLGEFYVQQGEYRKALRCFDRVLPYFQAHHQPVFEALTLYRQGISYRHLRQWKPALSALNLALATWPFKNRTYRKILREIGLVYEGSADLANAFDWYHKGLQQSRAVADSQAEAFELCDIARVESSRNQLDDARRDIEAGLRRWDLLRAGIADPETRASYFAQAQRNYEFYVDLLMQMNAQHPGKGFDAAAFEASEHDRARSLLDLLLEAHVDIRQGVDPTLLAREHRLLAELRKRELTLSSRSQTPGEGERSLIELRHLTSEYQTFEDQIRSASPHYSGLTQPSPLDLGQIQVSVLDSDTLLLEYALGEQRSYVWAVTTSGFESYTLPPRNQIEREARRLYALLTAPAKQVAGETEVAREARIKRARLEYPHAAVRLSDMILGPVASSLHAKRILVVSDGALQYIPFGVLPLPAGGSVNAARPPLLVNFEVVSAPSASTLALLRKEVRSPAPKSVAVLADPVFDPGDPRVTSAKTGQLTRRMNPASYNRARLKRSSLELGPVSRLPFSRREAEAILAHADRDTSFEALDFEASRATATSPRLAQYRIIHFATHGIVDTSTPALSALILSLVDKHGKPQDGFLRLSDIYNLHLPAELVVLSGCETALGKEVKAEGIIGLTRGFMYAGTPRVAASLWEIDDVATSELMGEFYRNIFEKHLTPAAALRSAQLHLWRQSRWRDPYFWGAFQLEGEWR